MKRLIFLAALLLPALALAATTAVVTPGTWDLYRGSTIAQSGLASQQACVDAAIALNVTRNYTCRTRTAVAVTVTATPTPVNCVVSAWSADTLVSDVTNADGSRTQTWTHTRTVTTQPANGGTACPVLTESWTVIIPAPPVDPPPTTVSAIFTDILTGPANTPVYLCSKGAGSLAGAVITLAGASAQVVSTGASLNTENDCVRVLGQTSGQWAVNGVAGPSFTVNAGKLITSTDPAASYNAAKSGDVILVKAGTYSKLTSGNVVRAVTKGGIAITNAVNETVSLVGGIGGPDSVHAGQAPGMVISGLNITGNNAETDGCPVNLQYGADSWRVVNNNLTWPGAPSGAKCGALAGHGANVVILGNEMHDIGGPYENHGIYLDGGDGNKGPYEIAYNYVHDVKLGNLFQHYDGYGTNPLTGCIKLHDNHLSNGGRYGINLSQLTYCFEAYGNLIENTDYAGLRFNTSTADGVANFSIHDNTFKNVQRKATDARAAVSCEWDLQKGVATFNNNAVTAGAGATDYAAMDCGSKPVLTFSGNTWAGIAGKTGP